MLNFDAAQQNAEGKEFATALYEATLSALRVAYQRKPTDAATPAMTQRSWRALRRRDARRLKRETSLLRPCEKLLKLVPKVNKSFADCERREAATTFCSVSLATGVSSVSVQSWKSYRQEKCKQVWTASSSQEI